LTEEKQKKIFFKIIGRRNHTAFVKERSLEFALSNLISTSSKKERNEAYRKAYQKLHTFLLSVSRGNHLYQGSNLHRAFWRQKFISRFVGKNQRILEVGCGEGLLSLLLARSSNVVTGIDISDICVALANKNKLRFAIKNADFLIMSATQIDFPSDSFDWVISVDVLEHLHPDDALDHLHEAARVLKKQGKYLLLTPNASAGKHAGDLHLKEYNLKELERLFSVTGFTVRAPLFHFFTPLNVLMSINVKFKLERIFITPLFFAQIFGLDPVVLLACKISR